MRILLCCVLLPLASVFGAADDPPRLAERGVEAYHAGRLDLARLFFERAYRQSAMQGREDWAVRAACNLADVAMETRDLEEADRWVDAARGAEGPERVLVLWKRAQLLNLRHHAPEAVATLDSALQLGRTDESLEIRMQSDRFRFQFAAEDSAEWEQHFKNFLEGLSSSQRREVLGLRAWARMRRKDYAQAESLWSQAASSYREEHRPLAVGEALAYRALCLHALDRHEEALHSANQAEGIFEETGYSLGRLRAQALQLLLGDDATVAKSGREIDFLSRERLGDDWKELLDDYTQSYPPLLGRLELLRRR